LLYDTLVLQTPELTIPHPLMTERDFVMKPLIEIAGNVIHPTREKTLSELYQG
ncbi:2-amino-4-hydroxy-6-hydroxymethyldihydropteridine diphosphokinase, partial [Phocaeicola plebeius]